MKKAIAIAALLITGILSSEAQALTRVFAGATCNSEGQITRLKINGNMELYTSSIYTINADGDFDNRYGDGRISVKTSDDDSPSAETNSKAIVTFDLSSVKEDIRSAELDILSSAVFTQEPAVDSSLDAYLFKGDLSNSGKKYSDKEAGKNLYNDLSSGIEIGSNPLYPIYRMQQKQMNPAQILVVNAKGIAALNQARGDTFAVGLAINAGRVFGAVPEPSSWALMIAGFAVVGFSIRRSKGKQAQSAKPSSEQLV